MELRGRIKAAWPREMVAGLARLQTSQQCGPGCIRTAFNLTFGSILHHQLVQQTLRLSRFPNRLSAHLSHFICLLYTTATMCTKHVSVTIHACGKRVKQEVKFDTCGDMAAPGHTVKENELGSTKVKGDCGRYDCLACNPTGATTATTTTH